MKSTSEIPLIGLLAVLAFCEGTLTDQMGWAFSCSIGLDSSPVWRIRKISTLGGAHPLSVPENRAEAWYEMANSPTVNWAGSASAFDPCWAGFGKS